jgi:riboflavin biosynthesis pyrimidine reductase
VIRWRWLVDTPGAVSPDPARLSPIGLPPAWPTRPWIYGNVIASANGIVTWRRAGPDDDPVRAIAGGEFTRPGRRADLWLMRQLRAYADAVAFGAQTLRDQPDLVGAADDVGGELGAALRRFRDAQGRPRFPLHVLYSGSGVLDLGLPMFGTPGLRTIVVTTAAGARTLRARGSEARGVAVLQAGEAGERVAAAGLVRAHERLFAEHGVRQLDCEGGMVALEALRAAGILDELFVTRTEVEIDPDAHPGVRRLLALEDATLAGEGQTSDDPGYRFERWRFNRR